MSKAINQLTPEDFGKDFDAMLFSEWKKSVEDHERAGLINIALYLVGLATLIILGGLVGVASLFIFMFIAIGITIPKMSKRKKIERELGITNKEVRTVIVKRHKNNEGETQ